MKLWWVHCEAMLALLMAYRVTRERQHWEAFTSMCHLCFTKVSQWWDPYAVEVDIDII